MDEVILQIDDDDDVYHIASLHCNNWIYFITWQTYYSSNSTSSGIRCTICTAEPWLFHGICFTSNSTVCRRKRFCPSSLCLSSTLHTTGSCGFLCASCPCVPSTPTTVNCKGIEIQFLKAKIPPSTAVNSYLGKGHLWNMLENPPTAHCRVALSPLPVSQSHGALFGCYHHMWPDMLPISMAHKHNPLCLKMLKYEVRCWKL